MQKLWTAISLSVIIFTLIGCEKIKQLPPEPRVEFRQFIMKDTVDLLGNPAKAGVLEFYFEDGDGDIGLKQPLVGDTDTTNVFFTLFKKEDGVFIEADESDPNIPADYRIPYIEREGQNKTIQGNVEITFLYFIYELTDTIQYEFYVEDRAGNQSNTDISCEIPFSLTGSCIIDIE